MCYGPKRINGENDTMQESIEPKELRCSKCNAHMAYGNDSNPDGDFVKFKVKCICGYMNHLSFFGYPKLFGTPEIYFEFTDEYEITCKKR